MRVFLIGLILVAAAVFDVAGAPPAYACSCGAFSDQEAFSRADTVFVGDLADYEAPESPKSSIDPALWTFAVTDVYKGEVNERQIVVSAVDGASCGLELPHVGRFLVFARREPQAFEIAVDGGPLYSALCDGTRSVAERAVPDSFGAPRPVNAVAPIAPPSTEQNERDRAVWPYVAGAFVLVSLGVVLVTRTRRRRTVL